MSVQSEQVLQLSAFIEAELVYHQQSVDILQALLDSLKKKYTFLLTVRCLYLIQSLASGCTSQQMLSWSSSPEIGRVAAGRTSAIKVPWVAWLGLLSFRISRLGDRLRIYSVLHALIDETLTLLAACEIQNPFTQSKHVLTNSANRLYLTVSTSTHSYSMLPTQ